MNKDKYLFIPIKHPLTKCFSKSGLDFNISIYQELIKTPNALLTLILLNDNENGA